MSNYELLMIILIVVLGAIDLIVLIVAIYELRAAHKEDQIERKQRREDEQRLIEKSQKIVVSLDSPIVIQGGNVVAAPATKVEEKVVEETPVEEKPVEEPEEDDPNYKTVRALIKRDPIAVAYEKLNKNQQKLFNRVNEKFDSLGASRVLRSTYHYIVMQGMDRVGKMTISRGQVVLECYMIEPELKDYSKENKDKKIKPRGIKFILKTAADLEPAFLTLELANKKAADYRNSL
jgi:hypothetical protein